MTKHSFAFLTVSLPLPGHELFDPLDFFSVSLLLGKRPHPFEANRALEMLLFFVLELVLKGRLMSSSRQNWTILKEDRLSSMSIPTWMAQPR